MGCIVDFVSVFYQFHVLNDAAQIVSQVCQWESSSSGCGQMALVAAARECAAYLMVCVMAALVPLKQIATIVLSFFHIVVIIIIT